MLIQVRDANLEPFRSLITARLPNDRIDWVGPSDTPSLKGVDVLISGRFTRDDARSADVLKFLQVSGAGLDAVDLDALPDGASCANLYRHEDSIAEYVVTAASLLWRGFTRQDRDLRRGIWRRPGTNGVPLSDNLSAAHVGFVGFGHIGLKCWRLFQALGVTSGCAVSASGAAGRPREDLGWWGDMTRMDELFGASDVVVVSVPDTAQTRGLVGARQLGLLGATGILINVGRGPVVDPAALYQALADRTIAGAGIDVWYRYPADSNPTSPADQDFGALDNVLMTPHTSGVSRQTYLRRIDDMIENVERLRDGRPLINQVRRRDSPANRMSETRK